MSSVNQQPFEVFRRRREKKNVKLTPDTTKVAQALLLTAAMYTGEHSADIPRTPSGARCAA